MGLNQEASGVLEIPSEHVDSRLKLGPIRVLSKKKIFVTSMSTHLKDNSIYAYMVLGHSKTLTKLNETADWKFRPPLFTFNGTTCGRIFTEPSNAVVSGVIWLSAGRTLGRPFTKYLAVIMARPSSLYASENGKVLAYWDLRRLPEVPDDNESNPKVCNSDGETRVTDEGKKIMAKAGKDANKATYEEVEAVLEAYDRQYPDEDMNGNGKGGNTGNGKGGNKGNGKGGNKGNGKGGNTGNGKGGDTGNGQGGDTGNGQGGDTGDGQGGDTGDGKDGGNDASGLTRNWTTFLPIVFGAICVKLLVLL
jgi:hypothetical protein